MSGSETLIFARKGTKTDFLTPKEAQQVYYMLELAPELFNVSTKCIEIGFAEEKHDGN